MINFNINILEKGDKIYEVIYRHKDELTTFGIKELVVTEVGDIHPHKNGSWSYNFKVMPYSVYDNYSSDQFNNTIFFDRHNAKMRLIELKKADTESLI